MALKDWRKQIWGWENKKTNVKLEIYPPGTRMGHPLISQFEGTPNKFWIIEVDFKKKFSSSSKAKIMKIAKTYMRTH